MTDFLERRQNYLNVEEHLKSIDDKVIELHLILTNHINDEKDLTPIVKELVQAWKAAGWFLNVLKWIGIISGSIAAFITLLKGTKP